jgi:thioredoxin-dependent peroxiredoxin
MVRLKRSGVFLPLAALALGAGAATAQQPSSAPSPRGDSTSAPLVGAVAPDFTLPGSTRFGLLKQPIHLADFRGQIVVLAFFPKARTKG